MSSPISLQYTITKEDYAFYYDYAMWSSGKRKKQRLQSILKQIGFVAVFLGVYFFAGGFTYLSKYSILIILLMFGTSFLSLLGSKNAIDKQLAEFTENEDNANIFVETFLTATETDIRIKSNFQESTLKWKAIINKAEINTHYFLFTNAVQALIIPKRAFINNDQKNAFDKILSRTLMLDAQIKQDLKNARN